MLVSYNSYTLKIKTQTLIHFYHFDIKGLKIAVYVFWYVRIVYFLKLYQIYDVHHKLSKVRSLLTSKISYSVFFSVSLWRCWTYIFIHDDQKILSLNDSFPGMTALHLAAEKGHYRCVENLLASNALLRLNAEGKSPRDLAEEKGHRDIFNLFERVMDQRRKVIKIDKR